MACLLWMARTFPNMGNIRWVWHLNGAETPARRITARRVSSWAMPAGKQRLCLIVGCTCLSPGLMKSTRRYLRITRFPKETPAKTKHELAAHLVVNVIAD